MMELPKTVIQDIREGKNLEVYLTLVVALVLLLLDVFGVVSTEALAAGTLATLALLAFSVLQNREQMQNLSEIAEQAISGRPSADSFFWERQRRLDEYFEKADFIGAVGMTLSTTIAEYEQVFKERLALGAHVRIMTIDPSSPAPQQAIDRSADIVGTTFFTDLLRPTIDRLCSLADTTNTSAVLELGLLSFIPSFGLILVDPDKPHGRIIVEIYQHKSAGLHPTFELTPRRDKQWYRFFRNQFDLLWESCEGRTAAGRQIHRFRRWFQAGVGEEESEDRPE